jgi:hypothetical protein
MSWDGTVRCRYCRLKGHNVVSCEDRKKFVAEHLGSDTYEGHQAKHSYELYDCPTTRRKRRCKWCTSTEHDVRKCPDIAVKVKAMTDKCVRARQIFLERMEATGFGIGTLVRYRDNRHWDGELNDYVYTHRMGLVDSIEWDEFTHHSLREEGNRPTFPQFIHVKPVDPSNRHSVQGRSISLPDEVAGLSFPEVEKRLSSILSPTVACVPSDFLDEKCIAKLMRTTFLVENGLRKR